VEVPGVQRRSFHGSIRLIQQAMDSAQTAAQFGDPGEAAQAAALEFGGIRHLGCRWWWFRDRWPSRCADAQAADTEVLLEAVGLEKIGELEGSDVAASGEDLALQVTHDMLDVRQRVSGSQQFKPLTLAVIAHRELLPGEPAVEFVCPGDLRGIN